MIHLNTSFHKALINVRKVFKWAIISLLTSYFNAIVWNSINPRYCNTLPTVTLSSKTEIKHNQKGRISMTSNWQTPLKKKIMPRKDLALNNLEKSQYCTCPCGKQATQNVNDNVWYTTHSLDFPPLLFIEYYASLIRLEVNNQCMLYY